MCPKRTGSDSRCCQTSGAPYSWRDYVDPSHRSVEELNGWLNTLAPFARAIEEGQIDDLFDAAASGELLDSADGRTPIKPIWSDPEIYELRYKSLNKPLRFYHGEPSSLPNELVALHRHIKSGGRSQQAEIEDAAARYESGRSSQWTKSREN